ncbi:MBL fold metallo-hydrolase [Sulfurivirga sp.]|uniref:MBL fold metallo-hydrolase n=1 Tax=Sulfurivirga sp. TaxID=2614236 RepID=UPI0025FD85E7|nr:MBL fold metallo-hydrolase [Sulfurivirga sp.]
MMKRRDFFRTVMAAGAGASVLNPLFALAEELQEFKAPPMPDQPVTKVTDRCYYILAKDPEPNPENHGFFSNPGIIITQKGVVVLETGSSVQIGEMVLRQIRKLTDKPVVAVINTHYHGDHWLGNHAFVQAYPDVPIYGHPAMMQKIKDGEGKFWFDFFQRLTDNAITGTVITPPNRTLKGGETLNFGDVTLKIHHYQNPDYDNKVHTESDLMVEVVEDKVIYSGDVAMRRIANASDGSFRGTIDAMQQWIRAFDGHTIIPGHGPHDGVALFKDHLTFFKTIWDDVAKYYEEGLADFEMKPKIMEEPFMKNVASKWPGYNSTLGKFIAVAVQEYENAML